MSGFYDFKAIDLKGNEVKMSEYKGKVVVVANTASECGFTPQYKGLEDLYVKYKDKGLTVLAFPCNQFGGQEPGGSAEIKKFCDLRFNITFPMFEKVEVNGEKAHPLFNYLKESLPGIMGTKNIKWNFTKFLIDKNGVPYKRYAPQDTPESMTTDIETLLNK